MTHVTSLMEPMSGMNPDENPAARVQVLPAEDTKTDPSTGGEIVFICGALRSGTTLLRLMIDHHEALSNPAEMDFLFDYDGARNDPARLPEIRRTLRKHRVVEGLGLTIDETLGYEALIRSLVDQVRTDGKLLTINLHRGFAEARAMFPRARFIHLLRDPRDVALSSITMGWNGNAYFGVNHWIASEKAFEATKAHLDAGQLLELRHEDLLAAPEKILTEICTFLGVPYSARMLAYSENSTYGAPDPKMSGGWRRKMTPRDVALIEGKVGDFLEPRGYARTGPGRVPSAAEKFMLKQQDRFGRLTFRIRRFGPGLTLMDVIGRKLNIAPLARVAAEKMDIVDRKYLK